MMKTVMTLVAAALLAVESGAALLPRYAQEVRLSGRLDSDSDTNLTLGGGWGYFVADMLEVGAGGTLRLRGGDELEISGALFTEYNFDLRTVWMPFTGAEAGVAWLDGDVDQETYGYVSGWGGAKYFLSRTLAIAGQVQVWIATDPVYVGDGKLETTDWALVLSTRLYF